jgi:hypothetical protein
MEKGPTKEPPDHGETIWIWYNIMSKTVYYGLHPEFHVWDSPR